ncbi:MAG: hypothetical protein GPJ54_11230 [Candidatus Heimdallarchaeota archaeon]|nr:hypothetical protein [Candidatus Heimdallarchaeota archaeon]
MAEQNPLLLEIGDLFPSIGMVVPYIEIKFRLAGKHGQEALDTALEELIQMEKMSKFEFNNQLHYKSKDDIPIAFGSAKNTASSPSNSSNQLEDLAEIVLAIGEALDNPIVSDLISKYKSKY